jgi:2-polyprenyl-3-methyl-5-hydroxy-6-metoxy-1,4-benzoquinol methylase
MTGQWPAKDLERAWECPVCQSTARFPLHSDVPDRIFRVAPGVWNLHGCGTCGSAWLDPRPTPGTINRAYLRYYTHRPASVDAPRVARWLRAQLRDGYLRRRLGYPTGGAKLAAALAYGVLPWRGQRVASWVRHLAYVGPRCRLLDVGAGSGIFVQQMRALGWQAQGVEPDDDAAADAGAGAHLIRATLSEYASVASDRYDVLTLSHTLEHLHCPVDALSDCRCLLRPGGLLWIATPNVASLAHRAFGDCWWGLDVPRHLVLFNHRSLTELLRRSGFSEIRWWPGGADASFTHRASNLIVRGEDPWSSSRWSAPIAMGTLRVRGTRDIERGHEIVITARRRPQPRTSRA